MTISVLQTAQHYATDQAPSATVTVTLPQQTSAGNCLVVAVSTDYDTANSAVSAVTLGGSAGNFGAVHSVGTGSSEAIVSFWADPDCAAGQTSVTVTVSGGSGYGLVAVSVLEVSGLASTLAGVLDQSSGNQPSASSSWTSGSTGTTSQADELAVGLVGIYAYETITGPSSPWVNLAQQGGSSTASPPSQAMAGYQILSATGTVAYSGTFSGITSYVAGVVTLKGSGGVTVTGPAAALALAAPAGSVTVRLPFPQFPLPIKAELFLNGTWTDISSYVYQRAPLQITRGRPNESQQVTPAQLTLILNNRGGTFSPLCTASPFYPYITLNAQLRVSVQATSADGTTWDGYRFWGEVSSWPAKWDPTGTDVYAPVTVSGVYRRMTQSAVIGSTTDQYYSGLPSATAPVAWWPLEDASGSATLASGLPSGTPMTYTGAPSLASDSTPGGTYPILTLNGAELAGATNAYGSSGYDIYDVPGTYTWTCPAGTTAPTITATGAGGGGDAGSATDGGGGGGGGGAATGTASTTPGTGYTVIVGAAGAPASAGGASSFAGTIIGRGGAGASGVNAGAGGSATGGTARHSGGSGAPGATPTTTGTSGSQSWTKAGTYTWTAPQATYVTFTASMTGAGGGGQGGDSSQGRPGGGGGEFHQATGSASSGGSVTVTVGAGGAGGAEGDGAGGAGGNSSFGNAVAHGGGGAKSGTAGAGGTGASGGITYAGGSGGNANGHEGGGGGGSSASQYSAGKTGGSATGTTGASGAASVGGGAGGSGGNGGGGIGASGYAGGTPGGGGGGGGQGPKGGPGGAGGAGQVSVSWTASSTSGPAYGGGGGGASGGTTAAGTAGSGGTGGAAVAGGGPGGTGGSSSAGQTPAIGPGGGGGGGDLNQPGASGAPGQVVISYTPPTVPGANQLRFILNVPSSGGTDGAVVARMVTGGTVAALDVVYHTGGALELIGYNAAGTSIFDSGAQTFGLSSGVNGIVVMVSAELVTSGTSLDWAFRLIQSGATAIAASYTGTVASAAAGNVSQIIINYGATETTAVGVGQVVLQYVTTGLTPLGAVISGYDGELAGDRFIRLCNQWGVPAWLMPEAIWGFESGTDSWTGTAASVQQSGSWSTAGGYSLLVTADGTGNPSAASPQTMPVAPGDMVSGYADILAVTALAAASVSIAWYDASGTLLSTAAGTAQALSAGLQATLSVLAQTAPASAAWAALIAGDAETLAAGSQFAIDNAMMCEGSRLGPELNYGTTSMITMMTVLQAIEDVDRGLLYEPRDRFGAGYRTRKSMENQNPAATLDYSLAELAGTLEPTYDDQLVRNLVTLNRNQGSSVTVADTSGPMSIQPPPNGIGAYAYYQILYNYADSQLPNLAGWIVTLGTVNEDRYPVITVNLARSAVAAVIAEVAGVDIGDFLQIVNPPAWLPAGNIDQLAYGFSEAIGPYAWEISINAVPESPYASGSLPDW